MLTEKAFEVLGLPTTARGDAVKAKWRELCMVHHPDRGGNAVDFNTLREAYYAAKKVAEAPLICRTCNGAQSLTATHGFSSIKTLCPKCHGTGVEP